MHDVRRFWFMISTEQQWYQIMRTVPDSRFATWISVKMSLQVQSDAKFNTAK